MVASSQLLAGVRVANGEHEEGEPDGQHECVKHGEKSPVTRRMPSPAMPVLTCVKTER
jgi:hypothetical protein